MEYVLSLNPLAVLYWMATVLWVGEWWWFPSRQRGARRDVLWIVFVVLLSLGVTGVLYSLQWGNVEGGMQVTLRWLGTTLYWAGIVLRYWAAHTLGEWFSRDVQAAAHQPLVSHGPYRCWRHPLYVGLWLIAVGMNVLMANVPGSFLAMLLNGWVLVQRVRHEEHALEAILGERYHVWKEARRWV